MVTAAVVCAGSVLVFLVVLVVAVAAVVVVVGFVIVVVVVRSSRVTSVARGLHESPAWRGVRICQTVPLVVFVNTKAYFVKRLE